MKLENELINIEKKSMNLHTGVMIWIFVDETHEKKHS